MKITNKYKLPPPLIRAIENDQYDPGERSDISVTRLIDSPRKVHLIKQYGNEITEDASDRIWSLLGQATHSILERAADGDDISEQRLYADVNGWTLSGQFDLISEGTLYDFKVTSVWSLKGDLKVEYERQLNVLDWLCKQNGVGEVERLAICGICKDWRRNEFLRYGGDYPPAPAVSLPVPRWSDEEQEAYVKERITLHQKAAEGHQIDCTASERWEKPTTYAVMKKGRKTALRVLESEEAAESWMDENGGDSIEIREGESTRCESYCPVSAHCEQYRKMKE